MLLSIGIENQPVYVQLIKFLGLIGVFLIIIVLANISPAEAKKDTKKIKDDIAKNDTNT